MKSKPRSPPPTCSTARCPNVSFPSIFYALILLVLKPGKVALVTRGRYAGRKAVILKPFDDGTKVHPFGHALVAGIQRYPGKVTARMGKKRIANKSKVKPFIQLINYNHLMPTRYALDGIDQLKTQIGNDNLKEVSQREEAKKAVKKTFEEKFQVPTPVRLSAILF